MTAPAASVVAGRPPPKPFSAAESARFARANPSALALVFSRMRPQLQKSMWLAKRNPFRFNVVNAISVEKAKRSPQFATLIKYIAASAPLHAADSTKYIGKALLCASLNDVHAARHFAYYAELRAAMSILACAGIGVFGRSHAIVTSQTKVEFVTDRPTHEFVWLAFAQWAGSLHAWNTIAHAVDIAGKSLGDIVAATRSGFSASGTIAGWMHDWGMDLASLAADQDRRNESTYRPTEMEPVEQCALSTTLRFIETFWELFDPSQLTRFAALDEHLVRFALETVLSRPNQGITLADYSSIMSSMGLTPTTYPRIQEVLTRSGGFAKDSAIFDYAKVKPVHDDTTLHLSMISRAALLSRLAIGSVVDFVTSAGVPRTELDFWLDEFALNSGLWTSRPPDLQDLWFDVETALTNLSGASTTMSQQIWSATHAQDILVLGEFERVAAWGIAS